MADVNLSTTETLAIHETDVVSALAKTTPTTLVEYLINGETIFPSGYDIAAVVGDGITMRERSLSDNWLGLQSVNNFTSSGMVIPASSLTLSLTMPLGVAYIAGRYLNIPATVLTFSPSVTSYVFLKVTRDASLNVTGAYYEVNTTGTPPVDATPIATAITGVGAITSTTDVRLLGPHGVISLTSGTSWITPAGISRIFAEVIGASGGGGGGGGLGANAGGNAGAGGTTTFGALTANGGGAGQGGCGATAVGGLTTPVQGTASGATVTITGGGRAGGAGGPCQVGATPGLSGANGGYAAGYIATTPGATITYAIGSAGTAGAASGGGTPGIAGAVGQAGVIKIFY